MSYSFSLFLLSQWNLFPYTFLSAMKLRFPLVSVVDTERRAVLSRIPGPLPHAPLAMLSVTSSWDFWPDELFVGVTVRLQNVSPFSTNGSSRATPLDRPAEVPPIMRSPQRNARYLVQLSSAMEHL